MTMDDGFNEFLAALPAVSHLTEIALTSSPDQNTSTSTSRTRRASYDNLTITAIIHSFKYHYQ